MSLVVSLRTALLLPPISPDDARRLLVHGQDATDPDRCLCLAGLSHVPIATGRIDPLHSWRVLGHGELPPLLMLG